MTTNTIPFFLIAAIYTVKHYSKRNGGLNKFNNIVLYMLDGCPFCKKVTDQLEALDFDYTKKEISNEQYKNELMSKTGKTTVPYIEINGEGMFESDDIVEKLKCLRK